MRRHRSVRWEAIATPGALAYASAFSLVQLGLVVKYPGKTHDARWAVAATACYLPLHLHHVRSAMRGVRPAAGGWTFAALAMIVTLALPVTGPNWLPVYAVVAVSAVLVLPAPWSLAAAAGVVVAQAPLAVVIDSPIPGAASYYLFAVWWRASALFIPIWLLGAIRRLHVARQALAEEAVVAERLRIDGDLRTTVGAALTSIATRGEQAANVADADVAAFEREVRDIVDASRRALGDARQIVGGYQQPTLVAELEIAASLLTAAGIETRVESPPLGMPATVDPMTRAALRAAVSEALHDSTARACVIGVSWMDGRVRIALRPDATTADRTVIAP